MSVSEKWFILILIFKLMFPSFEYIWVEKNAEKVKQKSYKLSNSFFCNVFKSCCSLQIYRKANFLTLFMFSHPRICCDITQQQYCGKMHKTLIKLARFRDSDSCLIVYRRSPEQPRLRITFNGFSQRFNSFPLSDSFWCICSRQFWKHCSKSSAAELSYEVKGLKKSRNNSHIQILFLCTVEEFHTYM